MSCDLKLRGFWYLYIFHRNDNSKYSKKNVRARELDIASSSLRRALVNKGILFYSILSIHRSGYMGAQESRRDDAEYLSSGIDYYQLLQLKEDASADEIKVSLSTL